MTHQQTENLDLEISDDNINSPFKVRKILQNSHPVRNVLRNVQNFQNKYDDDINNQITEVIRRNSKTRRLQFFEDFREMLISKYPLKQPIIITIIGPKSTGKSFLADSILSQFQNGCYRLFSKHSNVGIVTQTRNIISKEGRPIFLFDCQGFQKNLQDFDSDTYLFLYLVSSMIIYNQTGYDQRSQKNLIFLSEKIKQKIIVDETEYHLPKLLIVRRDIQISNIKQSQLKKQLDKIEIYQSSVNEILIPYPGKGNIGTKELIDIPKFGIEKQFFQRISDIVLGIKQCKPKHINQNLINSNIFGILFGTYCNMINRNHRVVLQKCWEQVIQTLSVGAYNFYILNYSKALEDQFQDQNPLDAYTLYKKLSKIKNQTSLKLQNFSNVRGDPIFQKYKEKLNQFIQLKQRMIIQINKAKSRNTNDRQFLKIKSKYSYHSKDLIKNVKSILDQFNKSRLEFERYQIQSQFINTLLKKQIKQLELKVDKSKLQKQLSELNQDIKVTTSQINEGKQLIKNHEVTINIVKQQQKNKQKLILDRQVKYESIKRQNENLEKQLNSLMQQKKKKSEKKNQQIKIAQASKIKIKNNELMIQKLTNEIKMKEQTVAKQSKIQNQKINEKNNQEQEYIKKMKSNLANAEQTINKRKEEIKKLQQILNKPSKKTCGCF